MPHMKAKTLQKLFSEQSLSRLSYYVVQNSPRTYQHCCVCFLSAVTSKVSRNSSWRAQIRMKMSANWRVPFFEVFLSPPVFMRSVHFPMIPWLVTDY